MMEFQWNALRVGHKVFVHDSRDADMRLLPGVVAMVDTTDGSNDIGIRVAWENEPPSVMRPRRLAVHLDPLDPTEPCWRCDAIAASPATKSFAAAAGVG